MTDIPTWWVLASPFVGYAAALLTEALRDGRARKLASEARVESRRLARADRRDDFQRNTLIGLQDALLRYARVVGRIRVHDEEQYRETGRWGRDRLPEEIGGEPSVSVTQEITRLVSRVADDKLRGEAHDLHKALSRSTIGALREEIDTLAYQRSTADHDRAMDLFEKVNADIGRALRELDSV